MKEVLTLVSFHLVFEITLAFLPLNWREHIDPEMLEKFQAQSFKSYSPTNFQGDITGISKEDLQQGQESGLNNAISDESKRWPDGIVPVQFSEIFNANEDRWFELQTIHFAMQQITSSTSGCIRFINRTTQIDYVLIVRGRGCTSDIGKQGGKQLVSLDVGGCLHEIGSIQHELLHVLGFYHEMSRKDRDEYIWINSDNIQEPYRRDFNIVTDSLDFGIKYDYESVLHYGPKAFAIDPSIPTIIPKHGRPHIGQNDGLSVSDVIKLKRAYNCSAVNDITSSQSQSLPSNEDPAETTVILTSTASTRSIKGHGKNHIGTTRPKPSDLTLPDFKLVKLSLAECKKLATTNCLVEYESHCSTGNFAFYCNGLSTDVEIRSHLEKIQQAIPSSPIRFIIYVKTQLEPETFQSVSDNIVIFQVAFTDGFNCSVLRDFPLPNLLQLKFFKSFNITISRDSLRSFQKMRFLLFQWSTIRSLEKGSLENLVSLKTVAFDYGITLPSISDYRSYLWRLHCSAEYSWLRDYLNQHPQLIQPRNGGELLSLPGVENEEWERRDISYPVDCTKDDLTGDWDQVEFSLNDAKVSSLDFGQRTTDRRKNLTTKTPDLTLPDFKRGNLSGLECKALNTEKCVFMSYEENCSAGLFLFECVESSTDVEIRNFLEKIKRAIPSSPIELIIQYKTDLRPETFQSVSDNIIKLTMFGAMDFNCDVLRDLPLPNLLELNFDHSRNITINRDSLRPFQKMRALIFDYSSILFLEKGSLENLISLKIIAFDFDLPFSPGLLHWLSTLDLKDLWMTHCSAKYSWLRDYLHQHPQLIQPRKQGEIYSLPGVENREYARRDIYYPVDCSKENLTGDENQIEFSLNDQKE